MIAQERGHIAIVEMLKEAGAVSAEEPAQVHEVAPEVALASGLRGSVSSVNDLGVMSVSEATLVSDLDAVAVPVSSNGEAIPLNDSPVHVSNNDASTSQVLEVKSPPSSSSSTEGFSDNTADNTADI